MGLSIVSKTHMRKSVLNIQNCERRIRPELGWFNIPCVPCWKRERERWSCFHPGPPVLVWFWVECKFSSVTQSCLTLCDPMDCSSPGFPVHHQLPELVQTHVHLVSGAIQSSHPLSPPSPPAFSLSQHEGLFQWVSSSHQVAKVLQLQLQHQSFQWIFRTVSFRIDRFDLLAIQGTLKGLL